MTTAGGAAPSPGRGALSLALGVLLLAGCGPRVLIATGTTVGIKATPGDGQTRPPQLVVGYKRAEAAVISVTGEGATFDGEVVKSEAASTLSTFYLRSEWTANTQIRSFIGTGFAARSLVKDGGHFKEAFAKATGMRPSKDIEERQLALDTKWAALKGDDAKAQKVLDLAGYPRKPNKNAVDSLQEYIVDAKTPSLLDTLEAAFSRP